MVDICFVIQQVSFDDLQVSVRPLLPEVVVVSEVRHAFYQRVKNTCMYVSVCIHTYDIYMIQIYIQIQIVDIPTTINTHGIYICVVYICVCMYLYIHVLCVYVCTYACMYTNTYIRGVAIVQLLYKQIISSHTQPRILIVRVRLLHLLQYACIPTT